MCIGLELTVNIDQQDYVKEAGDTAGLRLIVHSADRLSFPEDEGLTISPGHATSIGLRTVSVLNVFFIVIIIILFAQKQYSMPIKCSSSIKTMSKTHQARISAYGSLSDKPRS